MTNRFVDNSRTFTAEEQKAIRLSKNRFALGQLAGLLFAIAALLILSVLCLYSAYCVQLNCWRAG